ncbi:hypothetical protein Q5Y75_05915 [Ruegeria sp. 2205SS24-7]|uniref:hypothetical protein n=1 Tax=Ruegeria discodermiae TaxID=3064389 RepID=UPI0027425EA0|nr:hypothetical protein [Ruegeria sp. 2205SS24-7]MDP5216747.1 hypothetical protein [Ruegeria sp. 2205SS24-7]
MFGSRLLFVLFPFVFSHGAWAESFDAYGTGIAISTSVTTQVSEALIVVDVHTEYEKFDAVDPQNPLATVKGPCFGSIMIKSGQVSGGGVCNYTDQDGDMAILSWVPQGIGRDGLTIGIWSVEGGTGKWDGASGGGAFRAGTRDDGSYRNDVTGAITLP